jgi:Tol biopolymer transport system component
VPARRWTSLGTKTLLLAIGLALGARTEGASYPPDLRFQTLATPRVSVHFQEGFEPAARTAAALAQEILTRLEARYRVHVPRVEIVLSDTRDDPNGNASVFPYPLVRVNMSAPDGTDELGVHAGWLRFVLTHELMHIVHMEQARGLAHVGRQIFGRAEFLFPNGVTPTWMIEGLAEYEETQGTAFGRGRDRDARMVLRMAALDGRFPREDQAVAGLDAWPAGYASYLFGEAFLRDLTARFGPDTLPRLARRHAAWPLPYLDELTSVDVTGAPFAQRWSEFTQAMQETFASEAESLRQRGLTSSTALTRRGIRQVGARVSPDGRWIAYTSATLTRQREIRVMAADGSGDHALVRRNDGTQVSWTPRGDALVYDEPEYYRFFRWFSDLRIVDLATRRVRRLTNGLRASDPDVTPDGRSIVFVRRTETGSELAMVSLAGQSLEDLTHSEPGTLWSNPRVSPRGDAVVAARLAPDGYLDLVLLDLASRELRPLTHDRAKDAEPGWSPDATHIVFRSDRDGIENVYALRLADGALLRITRVLGGAFAPALAPNGRRLIYSEYTSCGYDLHAMEVSLDELALADEFVAPDPQPPPDPPASAAPVRPYHALDHLWPRYWMPYASISSDKTRIGVTSAGFDPLGRQSWTLTVHRTSETERLGFEGNYVYDRYRTTFFLYAEDVSDPFRDQTWRTRQVSLAASLPLALSARSYQALTLAWRGEQQDFTGGKEPASRQRLSGLDLSWAFGSARQYPFNISPVDGSSLRLGLEREAAWLGSDAHVLKPSLDARAYLRLSETQALAMRVSGATTIGDNGLRQVYWLGGFPSGSDWDLTGARPGLLRGYPDDAFAGRHVVSGNVEYRFPLLHPQRGLWSVPAFVRHVHGAVFVDAGTAWAGHFSLRQVKTAAGVALGTDTFVSHALPLTAVLGVARGFSAKGDTRVYLRLGLAF